MTVPPTPTTLPPGVALFNATHGTNLWDAVPFGVQSWNMLGNGREVIQGLFLVFAILLVVFVLYRFSKDFQRPSSDG